MPSTSLRRSRRRASRRRRGRPVAARLDRVPQPHALLVVGDVLDLVRDRAAVDLAQARVGVRERLASDREPQQRRGDARHQLGRERGDEPSGSSAGSPGGSDPSGSMRAARWPCVRCALTSDMAAATPPSSSSSAPRAALRRRHARDDRRRRGRGRGACLGLHERSGRLVPVPFFLEPLEKACGAGLRLQHRVRRALEQHAPLRRHRARIVEVLLEHQRGVTRIQSVDLRPGHPHLL